jgi:serine/threonine protein phosphatase PrpC
MASAMPAGVSLQCKTMRHLNEDRFTIIESMADIPAGPLSPLSFVPPLPSNLVSFFGVYDGHCGDACSSFLANALHKYVNSSQGFMRQDFKAALSEGILAAEKDYRNQVESQSKPDAGVDTDSLQRNHIRGSCPCQTHKLILSLRRIVCRCCFKNSIAALHRQPR